VAERPSYIYQGGNVMMHPPLNLTDSEMYGFFVKGDLQKLQASIDTPLKPSVPGMASETLSAWDVVVTVYEWIKKLFGKLGEHHLGHRVALDASTDHPNWLHRFASAMSRGIGEIEADIAGTAITLESLIKNLPDELAPHENGKHPVLQAALTGIKQWLEKEIAHKLDTDDNLRRMFIGLDLAITSLLGMLEDSVLQRGFDVINNIDFYEWLIKHGANRTYTVYSAPVRGFYDLVFAYEDGDYAKSNIEAGSMPRGMLKVAFAYQGGMMWKMQAGMGDTVFTPFYSVLKQRGVKSKLFHKVEELIPDGDSIGEIRLTKQVTLIDGDDSNYNPLVNVKGLDCWPSAPNYQYIVPAEAALMQESKVNLESHWSNWPTLYQNTLGKPLRSISLKRGVDFDDVVFGLSVASLPYVCAKLLEQSPALKATSDRVKTVVTEAYQVWLTKDVKQLGWTDNCADGQQPVLSGFTEPLDTWAPMDQLLDKEDWPAANSPKNVSYFCSAMKLANLPPPADYDFPARCAAVVKSDAINQLRREVFSLWPAVATKSSFDWSCLMASAERAGERRFDSQFWHANIDPSERYVLSVVGSSQYRVATNASGFGNLYLTGDWIKTGLNAGCVEAATMAGMQASRAISGYPEKIKGEGDF
jgi:uncharacterized protein with NAD-binding domain and iron-sulfur cluster